MFLQMGWYAHPVYSNEGNYPPELIRLVDEKSRRQNYTRSRLPVFSAVEIEYIKGTADFFGLNHYTTYLLSMADEEVGAIPSHQNDIGIVRIQDPKWPSMSSSGWLKVNIITQKITHTHTASCPFSIRGS
jgi:beta-glucosidase/6-phospho-beta-glucosidase/beta-galactosidase